MGCCPKCGASGDAIWEDNFWSGCNRCGWSASCENNIVIVPVTDRQNDDNDVYYDDDDDY